MYQKLKKETRDEWRNKIKATMCEKHVKNVAYWNEYNKYTSKQDKMLMT